MNLSLRLQAIYDMTPNAIAADIGSDHGKLIISLFEDGKIPHGYAVENKKGPFSRLYNAIKEKNLLEDVIPLFSDGIKDIPTSVSTVIIAGMGGKTIIDILKASPEKVKTIQTIIVDAHSAIPTVRKEISDMGFVISDERMVKEDGIFYEIIKFSRADVAFYSEKDLEFGPILRNEKSSLFKEKYQERIDEINHLLDSNNLPEDKIYILKQEKIRIEGVL